VWPAKFSHDNLKLASAFSVKPPQGAAVHGDKACMKVWADHPFEEFASLEVPGGVAFKWFAWMKGVQPDLRWYACETVYG